MRNSRLSTIIQLKIFIFEARVSLQILLQSLKQNTRKSAQLENIRGNFSNFFVWRNMPKQYESFCRYVQQ